MDAQRGIYADSAWFGAYTCRPGRRILSPFSSSTNEYNDSIYPTVQALAPASGRSTRSCLNACRRGAYNGRRHHLKSHIGLSAADFHGIPPQGGRLLLHSVTAPSLVRCSLHPGAALLGSGREYRADFGAGARRVISLPGWNTTPVKWQHVNKIVLQLEYTLLPSSALLHCQINRKPPLILGHPS